MRYGPNSDRPTSWMVTMFGWDNRAAASASRSSLSSATSGRSPGSTALNATVRPRSRSFASNDAKPAATDLADELETPDDGSRPQGARPTRFRRRIACEHLLE